MNAANYICIKEEDRRFIYERMEDLHTQKHNRNVI